MKVEVIQDPRIRKYLPWLGALAIFMQALDGTILNTGLPSIAKSLGESPLQMQSIIVSYTLTVALLIPLSGWLADRFGTKRVFITAVVLFTLGSLFCSFSNTLDQLILSRIIQAVGGSMMVPVARLTLIYAYPKNQLLSVINFITIPALIGPMLGPTAGGFLVEKFSWHWIFLINVPVGIIAVIVANKIIPNYTNSVKKFDILGWVLFSGGLTSITLVIERWNSAGMSFSIILLLILVSILAIVGYIYHAKKVEHPLIKLSLFKIQTLKIGLIGNLITRFGIGGMPLMIPLLLQVGFGYSPFYAGLMMIPQALSNLVCRNFVVPIVKKYGYRNTLLTNTILLGILISIFFFITSNTPYWVIIILMVANGAFNAIQFTSMNTISLADLDKTNSSDGNSLLSVTQQLAISLGISLAAMFLLLFQESAVGHGSQTIAVFRYSFLVMGVMTIFSSAIFLKLNKDAGESMSGKRKYDQQ